MLKLVPIGVVLLHLIEVQFAVPPASNTLDVKLPEGGYCIRYLAMTVPEPPFPPEPVPPWAPPPPPPVFAVPAFPFPVEEPAPPPPAPPEPPAPPLLL